MPASSSAVKAAVTGRHLPTAWTRSAVAALALICGAASAAAQPPANTAQAASETPGVCVAIPLPTVQGATGSATDLGASVRELIGSYLQGPSVQVLPLEARLQVHAVDEASQRGCGYLLTVTMTRKAAKGSALGKVVGSAARTAAWRMPYGGSAGAAIATGAAAGVVQEVASAAESTRAKDEWRLEYQLTRPGSPAKLRSGTLKAKAQADGEDLLTPLAGQLAEAVAAAVTPRSR